MTVLTVPELAGLLRVSTATIYRNLHRWPHMRIGTEIRFAPEHVEQLFALLTKTPAQPKKLPNVGTRANKNRNKP